MKSQKKPVVILSIDNTLFHTKLFKDRLIDTNFLDESEYIELLYLTEKTVFQELVVKKDIPINIFSTRKELLIDTHALSDTKRTKRLKDYLEDYKDYQIYFVGDHPELIKEAKNFNKEIITIWLQTKQINGIHTKDTIEADKIISKLEEILPLILAN